MKKLVWSVLTYLCDIGLMGFALYYALVERDYPQATFLLMLVALGRLWEIRKRVEPEPPVERHYVHHPKKRKS